MSINQLDLYQRILSVFCLFSSVVFLVYATLEHHKFSLGTGLVFFACAVILYPAEPKP